MEYDAEKLLECVQKRPALYNFNLKEYSNRNIVDNLWSEVANEMNCTVSDCKAKWVSLRNSYNRAVRETEAKSSGKFPKRKRWYLMDAMEFLKDFVGVQRRFSGINDQSMEKCEILQPNETNHISVIPTHYLIHSTSSIAPRKIAPKPELVPSKLLPPPQKENPAPETHDDVVSNSTKPVEKCEDMTLQFFQTLIPDMNKLSDVRKRKFKLHVMSALHDALEDQERESRH